MIFVFDLDDTVTDTDNYSEEYIKNFIKKNNLPYKQISKVARFAEKKFDWDNETALAWYKAYGDEMMGKFPCVKGAKESINMLYDLGHTIIIATARATDWHCDPEGVTEKWLEDSKVKYHKLYVGRVDKEKICEEEKADVFLDDDIKITERVGNYFNKVNKGKSYLMTTEYNKEFETTNNVIRVKDFEDFMNKLKERIVEK